MRRSIWREVFKSKAVFPIQHWWFILWISNTSILT
jgi:hypothetical protein